MCLSVAFNTASAVEPLFLDFFSLEVWSFFSRCSRIATSLLLVGREN